jgi:hypothetical protein
VTITRTVPISLGRIVGYAGNATLPTTGAPAVSIVATAIANAPLPAQDCITAKNSFSQSGTPKFDAGGCDLYSDGSVTCTGRDFTDQQPKGLDFGAGFAVGTDKNGKCGAVSVSTPAPDVFTNTLANNKPNGCIVKNGNYTLPATLNLSGTCLQVLNGTVTVPPGGTTITTSGASGSVLEISGGNLNLNGNTLSAAFGQGLTIVFTGAPIPTSAPVAVAPGFITGGSGTIDFGAPTTGPWSGVALYQDPLMTGDSNSIYSGSSPNFYISGLIYAPNATMSFKGAINHEGGPTCQSTTCGFACLAFIVNNLQINGDGSIFANATSQCFLAGLNGLQPAPGTVSVRQALVQ